MWNEGDILKHRYITDKKIELLEIRQHDIWGKVYIVKDLENNSTYEFKFLGLDWEKENE